MQKRPKGVSVVAWILIIYWGISLLLAILMLVDAAKVAEAEHHLYGFSRSMTHYTLAVNFLAPLANIIIGIFLLKGANWARYAFLVLNVVILVISLIFMPQKLITLVELIIYLIFLYFLYNRDASEFFSKKLRSAA